MHKDRTNLVSPGATRRGVLGLAVSLVLLAGCGGGGGGSPAPGGGNGAGGGGNAGGGGGGNGGGGAGGGGGNGGGGNGGGGNGGGGGGGGVTAPFKRLWIPHFNAGELRAYNAATIARDVDGMPDVVVQLPAGAKPNALAFDATDNLWVTDNAGNRLLKYTPTQLAISGQPTPAVTINTNGTSLQSPIGLAFDAMGNLWVAAATRLEFYVPTDLDESGPTAPTRVLIAEGSDIPAGLTFDRAGNLWLTSASFTMTRNAVMAFAPSDLVAGGRRTPLLRLETESFLLVEGIVFDARGDLWVANNDGFSVVRFAASRLALPMVPETRRMPPDTYIETDNDDTATGRSVRKPGGIAFDRDGNLFVNSQRGALGTEISAVVKFSAAQIAGLGNAQSVAASVVISRASSNPGFGGIALEID